MSIEHNQKVPRPIIERYPDEASIDPVEAITWLLTQAGHPNPEKWKQGLPIEATANTVPADYRRFLVNRHWRPILGMVEGEDTSVARYCMMDEGPLYTWLVLFSESVVPVIIKHNLPNLDW